MCCHAATVVALMGGQRTSIIVHVVHAPLCRIVADVNDLRGICTPQQALFARELCTQHHAHCLDSGCTARRQLGPGRTFCVVIRSFADDARANRECVDLRHQRVERTGSEPCHQKTTEAIH